MMIFVPMCAYWIIQHDEARVGGSQIQFKLVKVEDDGKRSPKGANEYAALGCNRLNLYADVCLMDTDRAHLHLNSCSCETYIVHNAPNNHQIVCIDTVLYC